MQKLILPRLTHVPSFREAIAPGGMIVGKLIAGKR
jgi:hypothetical protein